MPRSGGIYTLPAGYLAVTGEKIKASQHNPPLEDIASSLTNSLPRDGAAPMQAALPMGGFKITNCAPGTASTDAATVAQLGSAVPVGIMSAYAGTSAPTNWLFCYGQAISRTGYPALFSAVGTIYGSGDGSTTFNVPDCRGRVFAGKDNMGGSDAGRLPSSGAVDGTTLGYVGGSDRHTLTTAQIPAHDHTFSATSSADGAHTHSVGGASNTASSNGDQRFLFAGTTNAASVITSGVSVTHSHTVSGTTSSSGTGGFHNNVQPTIVSNVIIKAL